MNNYRRLFSSALLALPLLLNPSALPAQAAEEAAVRRGPAARAPGGATTQVQPVPDRTLLAPPPPAAQTVVIHGREFRTLPIMAEETKFVIDLLERIHFDGHEVTSADFQQLLVEFMTELDAQRLFFIESDRDEALRRHGSVLEYNVRGLGNVDAAFDIFRTYTRRIEERVEWVLLQLEGDFDFGTEYAFVPDRKEADWPADSAAADRLWRHRLKFELLQDLLNDKPLEEGKERVQRRYERMLRNVKEIEPSEIHETFLSTLMRMYDPHSSFFSADSLEDFSISMRLSLVGIGTLLSDEDGYCVVKEVIPGGPAELSRQIRPNDKIVAVATDDEETVDIVGMKLRKIVDLIRGPKGTTVRLTIIPASAADPSERREVVLVRDVVQLNASRATAALHEVPGADGSMIPIGVISLPSFYGLSEEEGERGERTSAAKDVEALIVKLKAAGIEGLVLDLRNNGGGLLSEAVEVTGLFIPQGPVVQIKDSTGMVNVRPDLDPRISYSGPLAVLVSRLSASASEIVAGALQNYGRAVIVGDSSTHGKGTVQAVLELRNFMARAGPTAPKMGAAKLTVQKFYLPDGASTQKRGIVPDVIIPSIEELLPIGEGDLPRAMPWDSIAATNFKGKPLSDQVITRLREASLQRQKELEEFAFLHENIEWFRARQELKSVSLNLEKRRLQKELDDAFRERMKEESELLVKNDWPSREINLDAVQSRSERAENRAPESEEETTLESLLSDDARIDIHLRESLRILVDALELAGDRTYWVDGNAPLTIQSAKRS